MDTVVLPEYRSQGVGGKLIEVRFDLIKKLNLRGLVAGSLPRDYYHVAHQMGIEQYVREVMAGIRFDSNLSKQLRKGFTIHGLIPDYTDNYGSVGWGVEIVWFNPDYRPARRIHPVARPSSYPVQSAAYAW